jgi:hypothetical protein
MQTTKQPNQLSGHAYNIATSTAKTKQKLGVHITAFVVRKACVFEQIRLCHVLRTFIFSKKERNKCLLNAKERKILRVSSPSPLSLSTTSIQPTIVRRLPFRVVDHFSTTGCCRS